MPLKPAVPPSPAELERLRKQNAQLQEALRLLEAERSALIARRFRRLLFFGAGFSLLAHISLMMYLNMIERGSGIGPGQGSGIVTTVAILSEEELSDGEDMGFDELPAGPANNDTASPDAISLEAISSEPGIATASAANMPTLGATGTGSGGIPGVGDGAGGGGGDGLGLGGGGGSASFFGTGGKGQRFAFIVDISGSMGQQNKIDVALRELARSIDALPDFAFFHVLLFESKTVEPPNQVGWTRARKSLIRTVTRWLSTVEPNGGTSPRMAFLQVFSLDVRPDVIFFLTDGIFNDISLEELNALNARGKRVLINAVGFGAPGEVDQSLLRSIATQSGGQYRFVTTETPQP